MKGTKLKEKIEEIKKMGPRQLLEHFVSITAYKDCCIRMDKLDDVGEMDLEIRLMHTELLKRLGYNKGYDLSLYD